MCFCPSCFPSLSEPLEHQAGLISQGTHAVCGWMDVGSLIDSIDRSASRRRGSGLVMVLSHSLLGETSTMEVFGSDMLCERQRVKV